MKEARPCLATTNLKPHNWEQTEKKVNIEKPRDHHRGRLKHGHGDLSHRELLMVCLLCGDHGCEGGEHEVDSRVRDKICLEFRDVHIQSPIKPQARRQGADDLSDQPVEIRVGRALNVQVPATNVVQRLIVLGGSNSSKHIHVHIHTHTNPPHVPTFAQFCLHTRAHSQANLTSAIAQKHKPW